MNGILSYLVGEGIVNDHNGDMLITQGFGNWGGKEYVVTEGMWISRLWRQISIESACMTMGVRDANIDSRRTILSRLVPGDESVVYVFEETEVS